mmetsp:Transcript_23695/g.66454  ORF Transcript_23695/g.66454 Transcript_23695/m.66454 type:complete len:205 (+) Transcript_23695:419-1033(+)
MEFGAQEPRHERRYRRMGEEVSHRKWVEWLDRHSQKAGLGLIMQIVNRTPPICGTRELLVHTGDGLCEPIRTARAMVSPVTSHRFFGLGLVVQVDSLYFVVGREEPVDRCAQKRKEYPILKYGHAIHVPVVYPPMCIHPHFLAMGMHVTGYGRPSRLEDMNINQGLALSFGYTLVVFVFSRMAHFPHSYRFLARLRMHFDAEGR